MFEHVESRCRVDELRLRGKDEGPDHGDESGAAVLRGEERVKGYAGNEGTVSPSHEFVCSRESGHPSEAAPMEVISADGAGAPRFAGMLSGGADGSVGSWDFRLVGRWADYL